MTGRDAVLATARSQLGYRERGDGSTKYGEWFADLVGDDAYRTGNWCAMGLLWCAAQAGQLDAVGGARRGWAWVPSWAEHFQDNGRWRASPASGRIVFFDFNRSGSPEHVGICTGTRNGQVLTIEFNTSDQCLRRVRSPGLILGYGDPDYGDAGTPADVVDDSCWIG